MLGENSWCAMMYSFIFPSLDTLASCGGVLTAGAGTGVPQACSTLWARPGDAGRRHWEAFREGERPLRPAISALNACVNGDPGQGGMRDPRANHVHAAGGLAGFARRCLPQAQAVRDACAAFARVSGCTSSAGVDVSWTVGRCNEALHGYGPSIIRMLDLARTIPSLRNELTGFRCEDFFREETALLCPQVRVTGQRETSIAECRRLLAAATAGAP